MKIDINDQNYGPWQYRARVYDADDNVSCTHRGIAFGTDFGSAAACVEKYFDRELISLTLYPLESATVLDFNDNWDSEHDLLTIAVKDNSEF